MDYPTSSVEWKYSRAGGCPSCGSRRYFDVTLRGSKQERRLCKDCHGHWYEKEKQMTTGVVDLSKLKAGDEVVFRDGSTSPVVTVEFHKAFPKPYSIELEEDRLLSYFKNGRYISSEKENPTDIVKVIPKKERWRSAVEVMGKGETTVINGAEQDFDGHPVTKPKHYTDGKIEVIDFILDKQPGFCLGNAIKYIARAGKKDPKKRVEDLLKAVWYCHKQIEVWENEEGE